ncbi:MAG TPA: glycosyltransferase family 39 protein [Blastocatellia bacterium]|nr:glycosyltransferase family 39 protein [Blastocatellia bacterium]
MSTAAASKDLERAGAAGGRWMRTVLIAPGLLVIALALFAPALRRPDGWLLPVGWAIAVGGLSLTVSAAAWRTRWQRCASLFALALAGQACALQLLDAPPYNVYQRYFSWNQELLSLKKVLTSAHALFLCGLLGQTVITILAARNVWPGLKNGLSALLTLPKIVLLVSFLLFTGVLLSNNPLQYGVEVVLTCWIGAVSALNIILVVAAIPAEFFEWSKRRLRFDVEELALTARMERLLPCLLAVWVTSAAAAIAWFVFEGVPHIPDDISYLFQAKYFSTGRLYLPAPPDAASFAISHAVNDGAKWFGYGFPGWPAVLALGVLAGVPWLVNPLLGGLGLLLTHLLIRRLYGARIALASIALLAVSPWFLFMSASYMTHPVSVVWALIALLSVDKARAGSRGWLWGAIAGISLGALLLTRLLEGLIVGSVIGLWAIGVGGKRLALPALASLVVCGLLVGGLILPYNRILTGDPFYPPQMKWTDENWYPGADRLGFGPNIGNVGWPHLDPLPGHGPADVLINANKNFYTVNFELFGWSFGSLLFVAAILLLGGMRRYDWLLMGIIFATVAGHSFYWFSGGSDYGARYWYQVLIPMVVLTVRGVQIIQERLIVRGVTAQAARRVTLFAAAASLLAFINIMPWRSLGKYYHYRGMSAAVRHLAESHGFHNGLVFVRPLHKEDYASAFIYNPPTLESTETIYALDAGEASRKALLERFPGRSVWFIGNSPGDGGRFELLAGPYPPEFQREDR